MKRGYGIREVLACRDEIVNILNDGYTIAYVHRKLLSNGKITIKYSHFHDLLKKMKIRPRVIKKIGSTVEHPSEQYELISMDKNINELKLSTDQKDEFGIIRKPEDEVF